MFEYEFMQNAMILILIISPLFGLLSTMVLNNRLAYFSDALGHSAYLGIGIGLLLGIATNNVLPVVIFSVLFAVLLVIIKRRYGEAPDTVIGIIASISVAVGIIILTGFGGLQKFSQLLVGDILLVAQNQLLPLAILAIILIIIFLLIYKKLVLISVDESLAKSKNISPVLYEIIFTSMVAITVAMSINIVGILLVSALFILPGAISKMISKNMKQYIIISTISCIILSVIGLIVSYYFSIPTGASIVVCLGIVYIMTLLLVSFKR
ncbi:MAG: metal ABC transporter permease [Clostridia bacterium]|nr:metal ABC transporter permease [Clostridia bacterium]